MSAAQALRLHPRRTVRSGAEDVLVPAASRQLRLSAAQALRLHPRGTVRSGAECILHPAAPGAST
jgi:hypothetical protein